MSPLPELGSGPPSPTCQGAKGPKQPRGYSGPLQKVNFFPSESFAFLPFFAQKAPKMAVLAIWGLGWGGGANFFVSVPGQKKSATRTVFSCPNPHTPGPYIEPFPNQVRPRPKKQKKESKAKREVCTHLPFSEMLLVGFFLDV